MTQSPSPLVRVARDLERMVKRYNPENDTIPNAPVITWADRQLIENLYQLVQVVKDLDDRVAELRSQVATLENKAKKVKTKGV